MSLIEIEWHPTGRQLRVFGVGGLLASVAAALVLLFVWGAALLWAAVVLGLGIVICLSGLVWPALARLLYVGMTLVALPIGLVVSFVLLAAFYFLLLTPVAFVFRLIGRDALSLSWRPALASRGHPVRQAQGRPGPAPPKRHSRGAAKEQGQDALAADEEQGRDTLATYWVPHKPGEDAERYFHQF